MAEKKKVKFIRRKGKVIPIRVTDDKKKKAKGAGQVAAGTLLGAAGGRQIAKRQKDIARRAKQIETAKFNLESASRSYPQFAQLFGDSFTDISKKQSAKIAKTGKTLRRFKLGSNILAGLFVQKGIENLLESDQDSGFVEFAKDTASQGAGIAVALGALSKKKGPFKGSFSNVLRKLVLRK